MDQVYTIGIEPLLLLIIVIVIIIILYLKIFIDRKCNNLQDDWC